MRAGPKRLAEKVGLGRPPIPMLSEKVLCSASLADPRPSGNLIDQYVLESLLGEQVSATRCPRQPDRQSGESKQLR